MFFFLFAAAPHSWCQKGFKHQKPFSAIVLEPATRQLTDPPQKQAARLNGCGGVFCVSPRFVVNIPSSRCVSFFVCSAHEPTPTHKTSYCFVFTRISK
jgi:hypothetical protein